MLGGDCGYLEYVHKVHTKVSRDFWKKVSAQNMRFCQNIRTWFWASFFQNLNFFHFSWHIIWLVCRQVMIFLLKQRERSSGCTKYIERVRKAHRKVCRSLWIKVSTQNMKFCQNIRTRFWASFFQNCNFFHFSWHIIRLVCRAVTIFFTAIKS